MPTKSTYDHIGHFFYDYKLYFWYVNLIMLYTSPSNIKDFLLTNQND